MKTLNFILLLVLLNLLSCTISKRVSQDGYYIHGSKKYAEKYIGEYANQWRSSNGVFGLIYEGSGDSYRGGSYLKDYLISHEDPEGEVSINEKSFTKSKKGIDILNQGFVFCAADCDYVNSQCYCEEDLSKDFYGENVTIKYTYKGRKRFEKSLYVPKLIKANFPDAEINKYDRPILDREDLVIQWNKDEKNSLGVLITIHITYPQSPEEKKSRLPHRFSKKSILVKDDGVFKVKKDLFNGLATGSEVLINIKRGRLPIVQDMEGNNYQIKFTSEYSARVLVM